MKRTRHLASIVGGGFLAALCLAVLILGLWRRAPGLKLSHVTEDWAEASSNPAFIGILGAGNGRVYCIYPTNNGGESALVEKGHIAKRWPLPGFFAYDGGAAFRAGGEAVLMLPTPRKRPTALRVWHNQGGQWGTGSIVTSGFPSRPTLDYPNAIIKKDDSVYVLCLTRGNGETNSIYAMQLFPKQGEWRRVRSGGLVSPLWRSGRPDARFAINRGKAGWCIASLDWPGSSDVPAPRKVEGYGAVLDYWYFLDACADVHGNPWVSWGGQVKGLTGGQLFLSVLLGDKWSSTLLPGSGFEALATKLVPLPNGDVALIGIATDTGALIDLEYAQGLKLRGRWRLVSGKRIPGGKDSGIGQIAVALGGDSSLNIVYRLTIPGGKEDDYGYLRCALPEPVRVQE